MPPTHYTQRGGPSYGMMLDAPGPNTNAAGIPGPGGNNNSGGGGGGGGGGSGVPAYSHLVAGGGQASTGFTLGQEDFPALPGTSPAPHKQPQQQQPLQQQPQPTTHHLVVNNKTHRLIPKVFI